MRSRLGQLPLHFETCRMNEEAGYAIEMKVGADETAIAENLIPVCVVWERIGRLLQKKYPQCRF